MSLIPIVVQPTSRGERSFDLFSRMLSDRIIFLTEHINADNASLIVAQLLFLESQDAQQDIYFYINSPGGEVTSGLAIYDVMNYIKPDVCTICFGMAASMASVLLSSGAKGKRLCFPNAEIMIHQVKSFSGGQAADILIHAERIKETNLNLLSILAKNCNKPLDVVEADADRDHFFTATRALEYGLIDEIIR